MGTTKQPRGHVIRRWRHDQEPYMTTVQLAERLGVTDSYVSRIERGQAISPEVAVRVADVTGIAIELLLSPDQLERIFRLAREVGYSPKGGSEAPMT